MHPPPLALSLADFEPAARWGTLLVAVWLISGSLLNLTHSSNWYVRGWDFPRLFTTALAVATGTAWGFLCDWQWQDWLLLTSLAGVVGWNLWNVYPYTPLAGKHVQPAPKNAPADSPHDGPRTVRLVSSNVLMENEQHDRWLAEIRKADPDVILALEVNEAWAAAIDRLRDVYPHVVRHPQENYYGMVLLSRLELVNPRVKEVIEADVPSIHTGLTLRDGTAVNLICLHPKPPEPLRNQDSGPRDAELVTVGRQIGDDPADAPTIVTGDLNDVAWSHTTRLFLRLSGLLDPRVGRGLYNSYNANNPLFRFPLDHFFHSNDFKLVDLRRLGKVGSDHFPMFLELLYDPAADAEQPEQAESAGDRAEAEEMVADAEPAGASQ